MRRKHSENHRYHLCVFLCVCEFFKSESYALISLSAWYCKWDMAFQPLSTHKKANLFPNWIELETWWLFLVDYITLHVVCLVFKKTWFPSPRVPMKSQDIFTYTNSLMYLSGYFFPKGYEPKAFWIRWPSRGWTRIRINQTFMLSKRTQVVLLDSN